MRRPLTPTPFPLSSETQRTDRSNNVLFTKQQFMSGLKKYLDIDLYFWLVLF